MAGAEPRDFYLFMWMGDMRLRAEIVVMFRKGGRPQCSNGNDFRVTMYDKCIWIVSLPVKLFLKTNLEWYSTTKDFSIQYRKPIWVWSLILFFNYWNYYQCLTCDCDQLETSCNSQYQLTLKGKIKAIMYVVYCIWWILNFDFWEFILENWGWYFFEIESETIYTCETCKNK